MIHSPRVSSSVQSKLKMTNQHKKRSYVDNSNKYEKGPFDEIDKRKAQALFAERDEKNY